MDASIIVVLFYIYSLILYSHVNDNGYEVVLKPFLSVNEIIKDYKVAHNRFKIEKIISSKIPCTNQQIMMDFHDIINNNTYVGY